MNLTTCPKCGEFQLWGRATCPCESYRVAIVEHDINPVYDNKAKRYTAENEIDWTTVHAKSAQEAAEKYVAESDQNACEGISNTSHVLVRQETKIELFVVTGELAPEYWGNQSDRWELAEMRKAEQVLKELDVEFPDELRPRSHLGESYYSRERTERRKANE